MSRIIDEHRLYLSDRPRLDAYLRALAATVRPGDVVLDLGAGTGILGLLACQAGAGRVYAVDNGAIIGLARQIAAASPFADRIMHLRSTSTWTTPPEPVDVVVTDQMGHFGFEAGVFEFLPDARHRLLRTGGRIIPGRVCLWVAPIEHDEARGWVDFWKTPVMGIDVSSVRDGAESSGYPLTARPEQLLGPGAETITADPSRYAGERLRGTGTITITRAGRLNGLLGWFSAELAPGVWMTNAPGADDRINRRQVYLPVEPVDVDAGDVLTYDLQVLPRTHIVDWQFEVRAGTGGAVLARGRHSTFAGLLLSAEDLRRSANDACPRLTRPGEARQMVLALCDGHHSVQAIEHAIGSHFPDLIRDAEEAAGFVAEVLSSYAR